MLSPTQATCVGMRGCAHVSAGNRTISAKTSAAAANANLEDEGVDARNATFMSRWTGFDQRAGRCVNANGRCPRHNRRSPGRSPNRLESHHLCLQFMLAYLLLIDWLAQASWVPRRIEKGTTEMDTAGKKALTLALRVGLSIGAVVGMIGCGELAGDEADTSSAAMAVENGLYGINGINGVNGLYGVNGLMGVNGISGVNGLYGVNGLSPTMGLMTKPLGPRKGQYIAVCALTPF